jgi:hypothetical protein
MTAEEYKERIKKAVEGYEQGRLKNANSIRKKVGGDYFEKRRSFTMKRRGLE